MNDENTFEEQLFVYGPTGGVAGPQGTIGTQGTQGIVGQGPAGNQGFQGTDGAQGFLGAQGIQGIVGDGPPGVQGNQGSQGDIGSGVQGLFGEQGYQGIVGTPGLQGPAQATTNYTPTLVSGANLTAQAGPVGAYGSFGSKKMAWGSGTWRWANASTTGGGIGNTPSISFPAGYFTTVQQFIVSVSEVGGEAIQLVNGDLSGLNTVGNFWAYRPVSSGSGASYFFTLSFLAIGV
jgi:hypothetical protein